MFSGLCRQKTSHSQVAVLLMCSEQGVAPMAAPWAFDKCTSWCAYFQHSKHTKAACGDGGGGFPTQQRRQHTKAACGEGEERALTSS